MTTGAGRVFAPFLRWQLVGLLVLAACQPAVAPGQTTAPAAQRTAAPVVTPPAETTLGAAAATGAPDTVGPLTRVRFRIPVVTGVFIGYMLARDLKLWEKYGLDVEMETLPPGQIVQSVVTNQVDIAATGVEQVVAAHVQQAPVVLFGSLIQRAQGILVGAPSINAVQDFKGSTLGVLTLGGADHFALRRVFARSDLDPDKDIAYLPLSNIQGEIAAAMSGQTKGFMAFPPEDVLAQRSGLKKMLDISELNIPYLQAALFTTKPYLEKNRQVVVNFVKGAVEGIHLLKTNRQLALEAFIKYSKIDDAEVAARAQEYGATATGRVPKVTPEAIRSVIEVVASNNPAAKDASPADFVDYTIADEIENSGLVDQLYR